MGRNYSLGWFEINLSNRRGEVRPARVPVRRAAWKWRIILREIKFSSFLIGKSDMSVEKRADEELRVSSMFFLCIYTCDRVLLSV